MCLKSVPGTVWGRVPGTPKTSRPDSCVIPHRLDRVSAGQTEHFHVTNGTRPRDGCGPEAGLSRQLSLCLLVFFFSQVYASKMLKDQSLCLNLHHTYIYVSAPKLLRFEPASVLCLAMSKDTPPSLSSNHSAHSPQPSKYRSICVPHPENYSTCVCKL